MAEPIEDLWPDDLIEEDVDAPIVLLRKQADFLSARATGIVKAHVDTSVDEGLFAHSFMIDVPSLNDYTYQLFVAMHQFDPYPVTIHVGDDSEEASTKQEFIGKLRELFASPKTKQLIRGLIASVETGASSGPPED